MDTLKSKDASFEIDHKSGAVLVSIDADGNIVKLSLSVVESSQLVSLLHKHINEAAVEKLRR